MLSTIIDRATDLEIIIVKALIDGIKIGDDYFFDTIKTDQEINTYVTQDLINKGYTF